MSQLNVVILNIIAVALLLVALYRTPKVDNEGRLPGCRAIAFRRRADRDASHGCRPTRAQESS